MTEKQSGKKGAYVKKDTTVKDITMILSGNLDSIPSDKFNYIGSLTDAGIIK